MIKLLKNFRPPNTADNADVHYSEDEPFIVYKLSEDGERYELYEPYDEANVSADAYADGDYVAIPLTSTDCKEKTFKEGDIIKNVQGSADDKWHPDNNNDKASSWIDLMRRKGCYPTNECCTDGNFYDMSNNVLDYGCHGKPLGGHIVIGKYANPYVQANGKAYLLSICHRHNTFRGPNAEGTGLGFYMILKEDCKGLELIHYLQLSQVEEAIQAEAPAEAAATTD